MDIGPFAIMPLMRIALGADHAGVGLKDQIKAFLDERGDVYTDFGTSTRDAVDYPDYAIKVAHAVASGGFDRGILFCGSGIGMAIAANKIPGIRAAPVIDETSTRLSREHNDANVLALGGRLLDAPRAERILKVWLETPFAGGRHVARVAKIDPAGSELM